MYGFVAKQLRESNLLLYGQPIIEARASNHTSRYHEVLLRFSSPKGILYPKQVLPVSSKMGMDQELDRWVISKTIRFLKKAPETERLSVNITASSLSLGGDLADFIEDELAANDVSSQQLEVEIDEKRCLSQVKKAWELARELDRLGCRLAIDDYLGLRDDLEALPDSAWVIKINGSLAQRVITSESAYEKLKSIVAQAKEGNKKVVAEFVSNAQIADVLRECQVDFLQGSWVGPTMPLEWIFSATSGAASQISLGGIRPEPELKP